MSAEIQETGKKGKGSKQKKMTVRVDFTPMVDMNMLLITFFMLCTTLIKPQTMELNMPSNNKDITDDQKSMVKASQAITLLLGADDKLYYYEGEPNPTVPAVPAVSTLTLPTVQCVLPTCLPVQW